MPSLSRRQVLKGSGVLLGASIAGCASFNANNSTSTPSPTTTETTVTRSDVSFDVTVLEDFTASHPARIEATFTNTSDSPVTLSGPEVLPFRVGVGTHGTEDARVVLIPDTTDGISPLDEDGDRVDAALVPTERTDGCWTVQYQEVAITMSSIVMEIPVGERVSERYTVLDWNTDVCLPPGTYIFSEELEISPGGMDQRSGNVSLTLGFGTDIDGEGRVSVSVQEPVIER